jgi:predicted RNase H-like HicB family nuclease
MSKELQITVLFEEEVEGGYTVTVPSLPGCVSYGKNLEEANKNIQKAIRLHLSCMKAHSKNKKFPLSPKNIFTAILHLKAA